MLVPALVFGVERRAGVNVSQGVVVQIASAVA